MQYVDADHTVIRTAGGTFIPADPDNSDYAAVLASGAVIAPFVATVHVPKTVEMWQARAALRAVGKLTAATNAVNAIGGAVRDAWEYGNTVKRDAPVIIAMGQALGISPAELDQLFIEAEKATA